MKNSKRGFVILLIIFVALSAAAIYTSLQIEKNTTTEICFSDQCVKVEVADSQSKRNQGLMFRESLAQDRGMFFIFPQSANYPFWMKNTLIPLDIIWISSDFEVVHIAHAVPCESEPCDHYNPEANALYVLEVNQGFTEANGISVGDKVEIIS